jgi:hypothetical protein
MMKKRKKNTVAVLLSLMKAKPVDREAFLMTILLARTIE